MYSTCIRAEYLLVVVANEHMKPKKECHARVCVNFMSHKRFSIPLSHNMKLASMAKDGTFFTDFKNVSGLSVQIESIQENCSLANSNELSPNEKWRLQQ